MKAYAIIHIEVHNPDEYAKYLKHSGQAVEEFGGRFIARGGQSVTKEGPTHARNVIIEFPDFETACAHYESDSYKKGLAYALADGVSTRSYTIVEGV